MSFIHQNHVIFRADFGKSYISTEFSSMIPLFVTTHVAWIVTLIVTRIVTPGVTSRDTACDTACDNECDNECDIRHVTQCDI